jgi:hypothetical protein
MTRPIDGVASVSQSQNVLELVQTAQRLAALAAQRQQTDTEKKKALDLVQVTREEQAQGKQIRDDDPRKSKERRQQPEAELGHEQQPETAAKIDIVV